MMSTSMISFLRKLGDDLDFEIKPGQPGDTHGGQARMRSFAPVLGHHLPDFFECRLWVDHEDHNIDDILETAARGRQNGVQIFKSEAYLLFQPLLRRAVLQATDLAGDE